MDIEVRLYLPDEGLNKEEIQRIPKDLELFSKIAFMMTGKQSDRGLRRVYAIHNKGKFTGYRIEDIEFLKDKYDSDHVYQYSEGVSKREITLEQMDKITAKLAELRVNPP